MVALLAVITPVYHSPSALAESQNPPIPPHHSYLIAVLQCAAGRASQRLQEASQHPSETIHRMLGWKTKGAHNEKDDDSSSSSRYRFNHTAVS